MDIFDWVTLAVSVSAAAFAAWQAWEARKARIGSEQSAAEATDAAKTAANAQATLAAIAEDEREQRRSMVTAEWATGDLFTVTNGTGETITEVQVVASDSSRGRVFRGGSYPVIEAGDTVEFMAVSGLYSITWMDARGRSRSRSVRVQKPR